MIKFKCDEGCEPVIATDGSAGFDLKSVESFTVTEDHGNVLRHTGVRVAIPEGYVGLLLPRSSLGHKNGLGLGNTVGVIDSDYRGEIMVSINNSGKGSKSGILRVMKGDRFAQLVVVKCMTDHVFVSELDDTTREGGFGSTGA